MKKVILVLLVLVFAVFLITTIGFPQLGFDPGDVPPVYPQAPIPPM